MFLVLLLTSLLSFTSASKSFRKVEVYNSNNKRNLDAIYSKYP
jgi:hypothetical protein